MPDISVQDTISERDNVYMDAYLEILGSTYRTPNTPYIPTIPAIAFPGSEPQEGIE